jgi:hypothetical protein
MGDRCSPAMESARLEAGPLAGAAEEAGAAAAMGALSGAGADSAAGAGAGALYSSSSVRASAPGKSRILRAERQRLMPGGPAVDLKHP